MTLPVLAFRGLTRIVYVPSAANVRVSRNVLKSTKLVASVLPSGFFTVTSAPDGKVAPVSFRLIRCPVAPLKVSCAF